MLLPPLHRWGNTQDRHIQDCTQWYWEGSFNIPLFTSQRLNMLLLFSTRLWSFILVTGYISSWGAGYTMWSSSVSRMKNGQRYVYLGEQKKRYVENRGFTNKFKGKKLNTVVHQLNKELYGQAQREQDRLLGRPHPYGWERDTGRWRRSFHQRLAWEQAGPPRFLTSPWTQNTSEQAAPLEEIL